MELDDLRLQLDNSLEDCPAFFRLDMIDRRRDTSHSVMDPCWTVMDWADRSSSELRDWMASEVPLVMPVTSTYAREVLQANVYPSIVSGIGKHLTEETFKQRHPN